jgi:SAM-dependent methyltransferase
MAEIHQRLSHLAMAERTRLLRLLELEELAVGEVARVVQMPQSTVSRHLKALEDDGWVVARRDGTARLFALRADLPEELQTVWQVVRRATDGEHADDGLRLASVLAARELDSRRFFVEVADRWTEVRRELYGAGFLLPALLALLPPDLVVADLGCGTGDTLAMLAPFVGRAVGVDREPAMLAAASARLEGTPHVELRHGTLEDLPLRDGELDAAMLMLVLHHVGSPREVLAEAARALRPGGALVVLDMVAHDREAYRRSMGHVHLGFTQGDLEGHAGGVGLTLRSWRVLSPEPQATGPALFLAVLVRDGSV